MPFALYHFNQSSNYSILANLLAVPITSFWLMPCVVIAFLLYPFHLEILALYPMKFGIELMLNIAHYISNLPYSVTAFAKMSDLNLLIIVIGMVWFCIWHTRIRFIGMILILLTPNQLKGLAMTPKNPKRFLIGSSTPPPTKATS